MKTTLPSLAVTVVFGFTALSGPAFAQEGTASQAAFEQDIGGQERIESSRKLRMLSQLVPAAACHLAAKIDPEESFALLGSAIADFDAILSALEFGDAELNINGAETRRKTIAAVQDLRMTWAPLKAAAEAMLAGEVTDENLQLLVDQNAVVLEGAEHIEKELGNQYFNPTEMVKADSFLIDIASRQRMFIQIISKDSCFLSTNEFAPETAEQLQVSMQTFAASLDALRNGMPSAGLRPPPTAKIATELDAIIAQWLITKPALDAIVAGSEPNSDAATSNFQNLNAMVATMNEVVGMYWVATEH